MNKNVKVEWVKALRSGEYKQGRGVLRSKEDEYCCLGVLCDVLGVQWKKKEEYWEANNRVGSLSRKIRRETEMEPAKELVLQYLNDEEGKSFPEIANYIEENL